MKIQMNDKTKKILIAGGAGLVLFLGGFGGGYAASESSHPKTVAREDRREKRQDETFGGFEENPDPDFSFDPSQERGDFGRKGSNGKRRGAEDRDGFYNENSDEQADDKDSSGSQSNNKNSNDNAGSNAGSNDNGQNGQSGSEKKSSSSSENTTESKRDASSKETEGSSNKSEDAAKNKTESA